MGSTRERIGSDGSVRYTALYRDLKGRQRSAGTFSHAAGGRPGLAAGRGPGSPRASWATRPRAADVPRYVEKTWLPNHQVEATTRQGYSYMPAQAHPAGVRPDADDRHPARARARVGHQAEGPGSEARRRSGSAWCILSAIFTTALNDQVTFLHPCKGVKTPPVPAKPRTIITPEQFAAVYERLPDAQSRLLVETDVESGLRWGELTELRVRDMDVRHPDADRQPGGRAGPSPVPPRRRPVPGQGLPQGPGVPALQAQRPDHRQAPGARRGARPWPGRPAVPDAGTGRPRVRVPRLDADPDAPLGLTEPNAAGHRYRHGTLTGYSLGRCRCDYCRDAYCRYRAERRADGKDDPRGAAGAATPTGTSRRSGSGETVWRPALKKAGLQIHGPHPRPPPRARLLAARRRRRPPGRQAAPRPRQPPHHREVPPHPPRRRRNRPRSPLQDAEPSLIILGGGLGNYSGSARIYCSGLRLNGPAPAFERCRWPVSKYPQSSLMSLQPRPAPGPGASSSESGWFCFLRLFRVF